MIVRRSGDWIAAPVGDKLVLMSVQGGEYLGLSAVGARIWELIETGRRIDELVATLTGEYDVDAAICRAEVEAFVHVLTEHRAATLDG